MNNHKDLGLGEAIVLARDVYETTRVSQDEIFT
jgi:hypothetical protein